MPPRSRQLWLISYRDRRVWCPSWSSARQARLTVARSYPVPLCDVAMTPYVVPRDGTGLCHWLNSELPRVP